MGITSKVVKFPGKDLKNLQILILLTRREARASLTYTGGKLPVPHDPRIRIIPSQLAQQGNERNFLIDGAGIRRAAVFVQSAFIAHPEAMVIPSAGMCADVVHRTAAVNDTIAGDVEMITDIGKVPSVHMGMAEGFHREVSVTARGAAMYRDQRNAPIVLILTADVLIRHGK
ncbi:hypothetical protein C802_03678 [Phocaeicola sartorii]|uniref:Uncharacterized protein n=1 Tax=Phocaeicola sartorii TaxID=671267 RepID=R9I864_9BACT|nr:hypothetical protein C802_03678 [Phocaeicola sartorii]